MLIGSQGQNEKPLQINRYRMFQFKTCHL